MAVSHVENSPASKGPTDGWSPACPPTAGGAMGPSLRGAHAASGDADRAGRACRSGARVGGAFSRLIVELAAICHVARRNACRLGRRARVSPFPKAPSHLADQFAARAQQRLYGLRAEPLRRLHEWLERYRQLWDARFEELDELIEELKKKERSDARKKKH